jgi:hypothetical protein
MSLSLLVDRFHDSESEVPLIWAAQVENVIYLGFYTIVGRPLVKSHEYIGGNTEALGNFTYHKEAGFLFPAFDFAPSVNRNRAAIAGFLDCQSGSFTQPADSSCECYEIVQADHQSKR